LVNSFYLAPDVLERHNKKLMAKYAKAAEELPEWRSYLMEDADVVLVGYGIIGRVLRSTVDLARANGIKAGLIRPVTLWPFPEEPIVQAVDQAERFFVVELSDGQMIQDVRLAVNGRRPVGFYGRQGGMVPHASEIYEALAGCGKLGTLRERSEPGPDGPTTGSRAEPSAVP
jgi:2-oxoglutarate ferredoxin oxidoreductase subunit alpha